MVVDTSALIAILQNEAGADELVESLLDAPEGRISAATLVEAGIVMQARYGDAGELQLDLLLQRLQIEIIPVTAQHAELGRSAYRRFGKGRHSAGLNFGDCLAYALAKAMGESLLYVGGDFAQTDVEGV